jgi:carotenoid 1,2-hydratase
MASVPLYSPSPATAHGYREVTAPGGYEWWWFDVHDARQRIRIVAAVYQGLPFHPAYLRRYALYRRLPTLLHPPQPRQFPAVHMAVYEDDVLSGEFTSVLPPEQFAAAADGTIRIGVNLLTWRPDGSIQFQLRGTPWRMSWRGPVLCRDRSLSADLVVRPLIAGAPAATVELSPAGQVPRHFWVPQAPLIGVEGEIHVQAPGSVAVPRIISIAGSGYHDHCFGTRPLGETMHRWLFARVLGNDRAMAIRIGFGRNASQPTVWHIIETDAGGVRPIPSPKPPCIEWSDRRTRYRMAYPSRIDAGPLRLADPALLDTSPDRLRLVYRDGDGDTDRSALCELVDTARPLVPGLATVLSMTMDQRSRRR